MKLLILGGTIFLGRHLVTAAQSRGHEVTLFNRGQHNPDLFPEVEKIRGDRDGDLDLLNGRRWDAVIDTCGYVPRIVDLSARMLSTQADHYSFISSISVYSGFATIGIAEDGEVGRLEQPSTEKVDGETYGPLKVLCEEAAEAAMPGRTLSIRPGLIVGPYDPTDRFTYWPVRIAAGGDVLTPSKHDVGVQIIDARDLAEWNIRLIEQNITGVFNATGPEQKLTFGEMVESCKRVSGSNASFIKVSEEWLQQKEVHAWTDLPAWVPETPEMAGFATVDCSKALASGLTHRSMDTIARDTLDWAASRVDHELRAGLKREKEAELLREWSAANKKVSMSI